MCPGQRVWTLFGYKGVCPGQRVWTLFGYKCVCPGVRVCKMVLSVEGD